MLSKELEILRHLEELYKQDVTEEEFLEEMKGKEVQTSAWKKAFEDYDLSDVLQAIDEYFAKKNNRTPPRIPQIEALLRSNGVKKEEHIEPTGEVYQPEYDYRYMHEDVLSGNCHHNLYYYTAALKKIRAGEYPLIEDIQHPKHNEMLEVVEEICEQRTGKKYEFLSKNDLISQGADVDRKFTWEDVMDLIRKKGWIGEQNT